MPPRKQRYTVHVRTSWQHSPALSGVSRLQRAALLQRSVNLLSPALLCWLVLRRENISSTLLCPAGLKSRKIGQLEPPINARSQVCSLPAIPQKWWSCAGQGKVRMWLCHFFSQEKTLVFGIGCCCRSKNRINKEQDTYQGQDNNRHIKKPKNNLSQWKQAKPKYLHLYTSSLAKDNIYNRCSISCPFSATPDFRRQGLLWQCYQTYIIQVPKKACMHFKSLHSCCGGKKIEKRKKKYKNIEKIWRC